MKKNGKRYRRVKKEKELNQSVGMGEKIEQEVNDLNTAYLSASHIVSGNPILKDSKENKQLYVKRLKHYIRIGGWNKRKLESAILSAYEQIILESTDESVPHEISYYQNYILLDLIHVLGYEINTREVERINTLEKQYYIDFPKADPKDKIVQKVIKSIQGSEKKLKRLENSNHFQNEKEYIKLIEKNIAFMKKEPYSIMVTATMSAGKSTFINALTGKYVCLSQNMACTSKIHCIINKAFEDGYSYEYDHDLVMTAGREELLNDNESNTSDKIVVSTYFSGYLGKQRIIVNDSPGVNFSEDETHKDIADRLIKRKNYNLLVYVMNATQLATNDEDEHLEYVKRTVGRTPVVFIMNKIDAYNVEEEDIESTIRKQEEYLRKKGFNNPMVCPISSRAGYLSKQFVSGKLSRSEERELYNYVDKFELMNLSKYYKQKFGIKIEDSEKEEEQLLKTCGLAYVEKIILKFATGGKKNGTGIR